MCKPGSGKSLATAYSLTDFSVFCKPYRGKTLDPAYVPWSIYRFPREHRFRLRYVGRKKGVFQLSHGYSLLEPVRWDDFLRFPTQKAVSGLSGGMPQKVSHINSAFQPFMWDGVTVFPTEMVKTGGPCGILLFPRAAAGGCYVGAPLRPRCARRGRFVVVAAKRCAKTGM